MIIYIDIDETICEIPEEHKRCYLNAIPIKENIAKVNKYYVDGHTVIYWTARGATTGIDWRDLTEKQLKKWNVKYHELKLDKPYYDLFICDKSINTKDL